MTKKIDAEDFKAIKIRCNESLRMLEAELSDMRNKAENIKNVEGY